MNIINNFDAKVKAGRITFQKNERVPDEPDPPIVIVENRKVIDENIDDVVLVPVTTNTSVMQIESMVDALTQGKADLLVQAGKLDDQINFLKKQLLPQLKKL